MLKENAQSVVLKCLELVRCNDLTSYFILIKMDYSVITFYKYEKIEHPEYFRDNLRLLCEDLNLLG